MEIISNIWYWEGYANILRKQVYVCVSMCMCTYVSVHMCMCMCVCAYILRNTEIHSAMLGYWLHMKKLIYEII